MWIIVDKIVDFSTVDFYTHLIPTSFNSYLHSYPYGQTHIFQWVEVLFNLSTPPKANKAEKLINK